MAETQSAKIKCPSCGRKYRWEAKLAGKRAKCKCGDVVTFPKTMPAEGSSDKAEGKSKSKPKAKPAKISGDDSMFDSQGSYKLNLEEPPKAGKLKIACPACGAEMAENAVICLECGTNRQTGAKVAGAGKGKGKKSPGKKGRKVVELLKLVVVLALLGAAAWAVKTYLLK